MATALTPNPKTKKSKDTPGWIWKIFLMIYIFVAVSNASLFFRPDSPIQTYYKILIGFHALTIISFLLNALAVIFDVIAIFAFWGFAEQKPILSARTWQIFFALRLAFFFTGHTYDFKTIKSLLYHDVGVAVSAVNIMILLNLPSYIANFIYAFQKFPSKRV